MYNPLTKTLSKGANSTANALLDRVKLWFGTATIKFCTATFPELSCINTFEDALVLASAREECKLLTVESSWIKTVLKASVAAIRTYS